MNLLAILNIFSSLFTGLEKLINLDLSGNRLSRLSGNQFPPLPFLRTLLIRENELVYVNNFAFANLNLLMHLA